MELFYDKYVRVFGSAFIQNKIDALKNETARKWANYAMDRIPAVIKYKNEEFVDSLEDLLTSSTCHPKFVGKERCNALMTFHEHCFADCLLVLRKVYLYCYDCLCERQHFVDAHPDL